MGEIPHRLHSLRRHILRCSHGWRYCRFHRSTHNRHIGLHNLYRWGNTTDCLIYLWAAGGWSSRGRFRHRLRLCYHHPIHVRNCPQEGPRCHCVRIPVLHHHWYPARLLRGLRHSKLYHQCFVPCPNRSTNTLGHNPGRRSLLSPRIAPLLRQARQD